MSTGNIDADGRVAMLFVDYPTRTRLKVFGRAQVVEQQDDPGLLAQLLQTSNGEIKSPCHRAIVVAIEAYDANCRKYIQPRLDRDAVDAITASYRDDLLAARTRIEQLERDIAQLQKDTSAP